MRLQWRFGSFIFRSSITIYQPCRPLTWSKESVLRIKFCLHDDVLKKKKDSQQPSISFRACLSRLLSRPWSLQHFFYWWLFHYWYTFSISIDTNNLTISSNAIFQHHPFIFCSAISYLYGRKDRLVASCKYGRGYTGKRMVYSLALHQSMLHRKSISWRKFSSNNFPSLIDAR